MAPVTRADADMLTGDDAWLCAHYGSFMHELSRPQAETMFWVFFAFVLSLLFSSSWYYGRVMERIEHLRVGDPKRQRLIYICFYKTLVCSALSLITVVMEAFAIFTLQFCDQEPLSSLYWSIWTVLQVGGVVAIFGVSLHVRHMIKGRKHPPWALALGTPVLVVAGLGHYFQGKIRGPVKKASRSLASRSRSRKARGRPKHGSLSAAPSIRGGSPDYERRPRSSESNNQPTVYTEVSDNLNAKVVGYTKEGDVILRLAPGIVSEFTARVKGRAGSISWDEPAPRVSYSQTDITAVASTPRLGRPRHRQSSSHTFKGKDKERASQDTGHPQEGSSSVNNNTTDTANSDYYTDVDEKDIVDVDGSEAGGDDDSVRLARLADSLWELREPLEIKRPSTRSNR